MMGEGEREKKDAEGSVSGDGGRILRSGGMKEERLYWQRGVVAMLAYERTGMDRDAGAAGKDGIVRRWVDSRG
ncbi:hypothetical protein K0M31_007352 [Melipona bicolor]|uniref:Uncharacterized protein n=1 Tax=Melipona bicolor TaxID=60889 RepID=A0AA40GC33_9HYME|nr:hypothetical protein K0M31_007352 [Melipona bicolor]